MQELKADHPSAAPAGPPARRHLPLVLALVVGVTLSIVLSGVVRSKERERVEAEFERRAGIPAAGLQRDIDDHLYTLRSISYFFFSSVEVDRGEFRNFTKEDLARLPGVRAFEWAPRVPESARDALENSAGADGKKYKSADQVAALDQFQLREWNGQDLVQPASARPEYFPIYFVEPGGDNLRMLGMDLASAPAYRTVMEASCAQGEPMAAAPFALDRDGSGRFGCRAFMAIYTNGVAHETAAERREHLAGYATTVLNIQKLVEDSLRRVERMKGFERRDVAMSLTDEDGDRHAPIYQSPEWGRRDSVMDIRIALTMADRHWLLRCQPTGEFFATHRSWQGLATLVFGLLFTAMLGLYLFNVSGRAAQVELLVVERTAQLARSNEELKCEIGHRQRAQEAGTQQERLVDTMMENIPDHIYFKDRQSRFLRINKSMADSFNLADAEEVVGRTDFDFFAAEHAQRAFADEQEIIRTGVPLIGREEKETWPDGSVTWVSTTKQALRNERGEIIGTFGLSRDITARMLAEEALEQKAGELARSNTELEQFAYIASHDLQEPLRMIASYTQLLERRYKDKLDADAHDYINFAVDGARRMQVLINDLLMYSRVGRRGKPFAPTDCTDVVGGARTNLKMAIEEAGAVITHGPLPRLIADGTQLTQLFQNLIGNAIKFRGEAPPEIHISAERKPKPRSPVENPTATEWVFAVRDNGIGIEPQYYERIFVIFQRLHGIDQYPGTGIGLALCKKIVERHGGRIWVESTLGKGTVFYFTLPAEVGGGR